MIIGYNMYTYVTRYKVKYTCYIPILVNVKQSTPYQGRYIPGTRAHLTDMDWL